VTTPLEVRVGALLNGLSACLCAELTVAQDEASIPLPCLCTTLPGAVVAYDVYAEGGMAWSRLAAITPVTTNIGFCAVEFDVTVEVGITRCGPVMDEAGNPPSEAEQLAASMLQNFDMGILHKVLTCCTVPKSFSFTSMGTYTPVGPDGGVIGGTWSATWRTA
jgi:hypothetical protein